MPTTHNIPARRETICEPCEFHKLTGELHVRCGEGSWRRYSCLHPKAWDDELTVVTNDNPERQEYERHKHRLELQTLLGREGRDIGKTEVQPPWCPLRKETA